MRLGKGSRFLVELPTAGEDGKPVTSVAGPGEPTPAQRGRLLVVDDDVGMQEVMTCLFAREHDVVLSESGNAAQQLLEGDQRFDVLLVDLMMPNVSGMDLFEWLAERNPALARQVIFLTGDAFTPRARDFLASVKKLCIRKPFDHHRLKRMFVERLAAGRKRALR